jgi:hypothetical protein
MGKPDVSTLDEIGMNSEPVHLTLTNQGDSHPLVEADTTLGYLRQIRDQLERTKEWGKPCLSLEIARRPKMAGRIGAYVTGTKYDKISGGVLGPFHTPMMDEYKENVPVVIEFDGDQLSEIAALNRFDTKEGPHRWTTTVSHRNALNIINQVNERIE